MNFVRFGDYFVNLDNVLFIEENYQLDYRAFAIYFRTEAAPLVIKLEEPYRSWLIAELKAGGQGLRGEETTCDS